MSQSPTASSAQAEARPVARQFVNFACFKLDPAIRRFRVAEKQQARAQFSPIYGNRTSGRCPLKS